MKVSSIALFLTCHDCFTRSFVTLRPEAGVIDTRSSPSVVLKPCLFQVPEYDQPRAALFAEEEVLVAPQAKLEYMVNKRGSSG